MLIETVKIAPRSRSCHPVRARGDKQEAENVRKIDIMRCDILRCRALSTTSSPEYQRSRAIMTSSMPRAHAAGLSAKQGNTG